MAVLAAVTLAVPAFDVRAASYPCDETGLDAALAAGGLATFGCNGATTITVSATKNITVSGTILDGDGLLTLSGGNARRVLDVTTVAELRNLTITGGNATTGDGGGIRNTGNALTLTNVTVSGNTTSNAGGGVASSGATPLLTITGSTISGNTATNVRGGGILMRGGTLTITNSTVSGNTAPAAEGGGVAVMAGAGATVTRSTITANTVNTAISLGGSGVYVENTSSLTLTGSIVAGNTTPAFSQLNIASGGMLTDGGNNVIGNNAGNTLVDMMNGNRVGSTGTPLDPLLGPLTNNGGPTRTHAPQAGSPAVNRGGTCTGTTATDQRGATRSFGGACDAGSVERVLVVYAQPGAMNGTGTMAAPFGSAATALTTVIGGGTVNLLAGTYNERLTVDKGVTLAGAGESTTTLNGQMTGSVVTITSGVAATINGLTITGGLVSDNDGNAGGGGIRNNGTMLTITNSTIRNNATTNGNVGGGIFNSNGGTLIVTNSTIRDNNADNNGGGIYNTGPVADGTVTITGSTISGNTTTDGGGGGIHNTGQYDGGTVTITGSTISGNTATSGGGINTNGGTLTVTGSTISGNTANGGVNGGNNDGGGGIFSNGTALTIGGTILSGNTVATGTDYDGPGNSTTDNGRNLIGTSITHTFAMSGTNGANVFATNPRLGPLANNGGTTQTRQPLPGSPAVNAGGSCTGTDQRGVMRPQPVGGQCDIGSVEAVFFTPVFVAPNGTGNGSTAASPLGSLGAAQQVVSVGGTVNLAAGTYNERVTLSYNITITGAGASTTTLNGQMMGSVVVVNTGVTATISGLTITGGAGSGGNGAGEGGGIANEGGALTVTGVTISGNKAVGGGGISTKGGSLTVGSSTISGNTATNGGGILSVDSVTSVTDSTIRGNTGGPGSGGSGGILTYGDGTFALTRSTVSGNIGIQSSIGGGIANSVAMTITSSTISDNTNTDNGRSGGIVNSGTLTVTGSTITGNAATFGGGIYNHSGGTLTIGSTILSGNTAPNGPDLLYIDGTVTDNGRNLIGTSTGHTFAMSGTNGANVFATNPGLQPLGDNGGGTRTRLPLSGSPAVDAGGGACPTTDQRGQARPSGGACDIGAVEYQTVRPTLNAAQAGATGDQVVTLTGAGFQRNTTITIGSGQATVQSVSPDGTQITVRVTGQPVGTSILVIAANPNVAATSGMLAFVAPAAAPMPTRPAAPTPVAPPLPVAAPPVRMVPTPGGSGPPTATPLPAPMRR